MRIVVNNIAASTGGTLTLLRDFYNCICENDRENQWIFLLGDKYLEETENIKVITLPKVKASKIRKLWFDFVSGRHFINRLKPDVVLSLQNIITFGVKVPQAVYIHQSVPFQNIKVFSFLQKKERKLATVQHLIGAVIKKSAKKSDLIFVQTQWMKEAVCRLCRIPAYKVCTNQPQVKLPELSSKPKPYDPTAFFYPTGGSIYKNNDCVFKASEILDSKGVSHKVTMTARPEMSRGSVICTGRLPYSEVFPQYYSSTLVFPSYIEAFGYPLAEAKIAGAIVLASDTPFSHEVLDGYANAYFFDPFQPEQLAALMEQVATGKVERKQVIPQDTKLTDNWKDVMDHILQLKN